MSFQVVLLFQCVSKVADKPEKFKEKMRLLAMMLKNNLRILYFLLSVTINNKIPLPLFWLSHRWFAENGNVIRDYSFSLLASSPAFFVKNTILCSRWPRCWRCSWSLLSSHPPPTARWSLISLLPGEIRSLRSFNGLSGRSLRVSWMRYCCSVVVWWRYTAAITTGLSFSVILLGKCLSLHKGLAEYIEGQSFELSIKGFKTRKLRPKPTAKLPTYGRRRFW